MYACVDIISWLFRIIVGFKYEPPELDVREAGRAAAREHLAPEGLLLAISFHSGEDGGVKRFLGISTDNRLAITPDILGRMFAFLDRNTIVGSLYRSAFSIALFGLLRCSEFAWSAKDDPAKLLTRSSVLFEPDMSGVKINVNASKTDFFRKGCCIRIGCRCDPSKPDRICPVHELKHFMDSVPGLPNEPLFRLAGTILNRDMVTKMLDALCDRLGLDKKLFKSHSFRKGGATALKNAGVPDSVIKVIGRWLSNSYRLYVQYSDGDLFKFSDLMF